MRWLHLAAAAASLLLCACAGHGPRLSLPVAPAPYTEQVGGPGWQASATRGRATLEEARRRHGLPSLSVAVMANGKLAWAAASGWADVEGGVPASLATRYRIGSTSKAITATALARLVDQGRMSLDAPIST